MSSEKGKLETTVYNLCQSSRREQWAGGEVLAVRECAEDQGKDGIFQTWEKMTVTLSLLL